MENELGLDREFEQESDTEEVIIINHDTSNGSKIGFVAGSEDRLA